MILNQGIDTLIGLNTSGVGLELDSLANALQVGTGSTAPNATDTALDSALTPRTTSNGGFTAEGPTWSGTDYIWRRFNRLFADDQVNNNLTEFAYWRQLTDNANQRIWNRELFRDPDPPYDPITITKTSDEQLRVRYETRLYPWPSDISDSTSLDGNSYDYNIRAFAVGAANNWNIWTSAPMSPVVSNGHCGETQTQPSTTDTAETGMNTDASSVVVSTYSNGDFYRDTTITYNPGQANFTLGIGMQIIGHRGSGGVAFNLATVRWNPRIPKDNTLRLITTYRWTFTRP